jgi:hypothetical protein
MAYTAMSQICGSSIVIEGRTRVQTISGKLAGSYKPGQMVYESATRTWTTTPGTAAQYKRTGWIEFKYRTSSTFGEVDIDTAYTDGTAINVEIIVGPRDGTIKIGAITKDFSGTKYFGEELYAGSSGALQLGSEMTSATVQAILAEEGAVATSTVAKVYIV